ncbi:MAG TPA: hypothetical protein PKL73_21955 [Polyangiaceae bacterium]|jgi:hypothetical protein|nr:MAG: hypothetical protein BWY17_00643 [Deltaproteobacteria bacterium ADurb.Bin207]HNS99639.1 hypothetical protein [Polyangiaceae bacterium]HNZ24484.1 hypothetical protein [Polyangiaceae bacterium]HOD22913.1 hypothetical protein [Polyangiaceae bacterium]HOE50811.1 hypothetical protein [Polyangiaceae bacterium]
MPFHAKSAESDQGQGVNHPELRVRDVAAIAANRKTIAGRQQVTVAERHASAILQTPSPFERNPSVSERNPSVSERNPSSSGKKGRQDANFASARVNLRPSDGAGIDEPKDRFGLSVSGYLLYAVVCASHWTGALR